MGEVNNRAVAGSAVLVLGAMATAWSRSGKSTPAMCRACEGRGSIEVTEYSSDERGEFALGTYTDVCESCAGSGVACAPTALNFTLQSCLDEAVTRALRAGAFDALAARERMAQWTQIVACDWLEGHRDLDVESALDLAVRFAAQAGAHDTAARNRFRRFVEQLALAWGAPARTSTGGDDACPF